MNLETHNSNFTITSDWETFAGQSPELPLFQGAAGGEISQHPSWI